MTHAPRRAERTTPPRDTPEMTPAELKTIRESLGLSCPQLAALLGVTERSVRHWEDEKYPIPGAVPDAIESIARDSDAHADALAARLRGAPEPLLTVYRSDADYHHADPASPYPASWHRAVAAQVRREIPGLRLAFPSPDDIAPVPVSAGRPVTDRQRLQLTDVLQGVFIDEVALADPRGFLLAEIEDCLDDVTGRTAYPELLTTARLWSAEQCATILREYAPASPAPTRETSQ